MCHHRNSDRHPRSIGDDVLHRRKSTRKPPVLGEFDRCTDKAAQQQGPAGTAAEEDETRPEGDEQEHIQKDVDSGTTTGAESHGTKWGWAQRGPGNDRKAQHAQHQSTDLASWRPWDLAR